MFYPAEKFAAHEKRLREYLPNFDSKEYEAKHEITDQMRGDMREWLTEKAAG